MAATEVGIKLRVTGQAQAEASLDGVARRVDGLSTSLSRVGHYGAALIGVTQGIVPMSQALLRSADAVTTLNNRLKLATGSASAASSAYESLFDIAQRSRVGFVELGGTFASIARASQSLGLSQQRLLGVTEAIGNAMTISGGSAQSMQAALMQLGQGLASGTLRGEELNSVMEQTPRLAQAIADGLGVSIGKLREMGTAGQLTGEQVVKALESQAAVLSGEVRGAVLTVGQAMTQLNNATVKAVGEMDAATGASSALASALSSAAGAVGSVGEAFKAHETTIRVGLGLLAGAATAAGLARVATAMGAAGVAGSIGVVRTAFLGLTAAMAANPVGLALLGLGAVVGGTMMLGSGTTSPAEQLRTLERDAQRLATAEARLAANGGAGQGRYSARLEAHIEGLRASVQAQVQALGELGNADAKLASLAARRQQAAQGDTAASAEAAQALAALTGQKKDYIATLNKYQDWLKTGAVTEQQYIALTNELASSNHKAAQSVRTRAASSATLTEAQREQAEQEKWLLSMDVAADQYRQQMFARRIDEHDKLLQASQEAYATDLATYTASATSAQQRLQDLTDQADAVAYAEAHQISLAQAVEHTTIARLKEQQVAAMGNEAAVMALQAEIEARQKIIGVLGSTETRDAARELRKNEEAEWAKTWDQVGQSFTDALMEGGKSVSEYLKGLFRTLVLRPMLAPISGGMASLFGGNAAAGQGGAGAAGSMDMLSSVGSLYNAVSNGVSSSVTAGFTQLMSSDFGQKIGMSYYDGNAYQLTGTGQSVGSAMGVAGNAMAGYGLQKAISGGYEVGNGNLVDAITIAASAYFGPIAGAVAGVFNRAFGRQLKDIGLEGGFGGEEGFSGQQYQFYKGGWLRSDKTKYSDMDAGMQTALGDQFKALQMQTGLMATALGQGTDAIAAFTQDIKISFQGLSEEQIAQKLQEQFAGVADNLANLVLGETDLAKAGETAAQTLGRLSTSLTTVNAISDTLGWALQSVSLAGGAAASTFADLFGGLDKMAAATSSYYDAFYAESERSATATRQLTTQLAALGMALPASRDAYRDLIDNALASGNQQLAADLIMLSGAFAALSQSTDDLAAQATSAAQELASAGEDLRSALAGLLQPLLDAVASARAQVSGAMATVAGLPGPTLQQLRDQVAAQQVTLPSAAGVLGAQATADAAYLRLADTQTATAVYQRQADSANAALQAAVAQSAAAATAFGNTKTSIVAAEAAENAAFAKLGYAYGGGFTVDAQGKPVWSNTEMNGQSRWAKSLGGGWNASLGAYEGPAALAAMRGGTAGQWNDYWSSMGTSGAPTQDPNAPWNRLDALSKQYGTDLTALTKAQAAQTTAAAAQAAASAKLTGATTARAQAQAAVDAATAAQAKAQADYAAALRGYVADASKAVDKLSDLREQTVAYYEAQKQLADGMTASAQRLREAAQAMRFGQLSAAQSLAQQRQQFDRQYTLALSTGGMVQAGYADQLASSLPALSESIKATSTSRADWATATARLFAQSQTVAAALEANAPKDYQAESLAVLAQIDGTLAVIEAATSSAEKIISDAIFESGDNTLAGLRAVIAAIKGETIPAFANGGAFTSGIVSRPTAFNMGLMGEAGPEAIMPLANIGGSLGVRVTSGRDDGALIAEMQALRAEVQALRAEARATAINTGRTQDLMKRVTRNGEAMQTEAST